MSHQLATRPHRRSSPAPAMSTTPRPIFGQPLYWRRWAFAASAVFNLVFTLVIFHTRRLTYAPLASSTATPPPSALVWAIRLSFWGALGLATAGGVVIALGLTQRYYHACLRVTLGGSFFIALFFGGIEAWYSLSVGYGFSEPLCWLLIGALQTAITLSAFKAPPPRMLEPVVLAHDIMLRARAGVRAFTEAWRLEAGNANRI